MLLGSSFGSPSSLRPTRALGKDRAVWGRFLRGYNGFRFRWIVLMDVDFYWMLVLYFILSLDALGPRDGEKQDMNVPNK